MTKLRWENDFTTDGRFMIQTSHVRGEGVCYYLDMRPHGTREQETAIAEIETCFYGRGGKAKVKAAAQMIADLLDGGRA